MAQGRRELPKGMMRKIKRASRIKKSWTGKEHPPITRRFCNTCKQRQIFKYNEMIGHSRCVVCKRT